MNGILLVDKPKGITSHDVVDKLRKILNISAIGHAGTLDPLATGLLVCLIGEATKLSQYVMSEEKEYEVLVRLGAKTDSGDVTGKTLSEKPVPTLPEDRITQVLETLTGCIELPVPKYSAVKVKGRKLYEYARENMEIDVPKKMMTILDAKVLKRDQDTIRLTLRCEKGTYVRSWVETLGERLGTLATVEELRRTRSGDYTLERAVTLVELEQDRELCSKAILRMGQTLKAWPALKLLGRDVNLIKNGQLPVRIDAQLRHAQIATGVRLIDEGENLLALVVRDANKGMKIARIFR